MINKLTQKQIDRMTFYRDKWMAIPPGTWRIGKVREYDHFAEEARSVAD